MMKINRFFIVLLLIIMSNSSFSIEVSVLPNYRPGHNYDLELIVDGKITKKRIWNKGKALEWKRITPVSVTLPSPKKDQRISLHTARASKSGVEVPTFVSVYCKMPQGIYHISSTYIDRVKLADNSDGWIDLGTTDVCVNDIEVVIHARLNYIMIDEIKMESGPASLKGKSSLSVISQESAIDHSIQELKDYYGAAYKAEKNKLLKNVENELSFFVWRADKGLRIGGGHSEKLVDDSIHWAYGDSLVTYLLVTNKLDEQQEFSIGLPEKTVITSVQRVEPVMARNGVVSYDVIASESNELLAGVISKNDIFMYRVEINVEEESEIELTLNYGNKKSVAKKIRINKLPKTEKLSNIDFYTGGWAYSNHHQNRLSHWTH